MPFRVQFGSLKEDLDLGGYPYQEGKYLTTQHSVNADQSAIWNSFFGVDLVHWLS